MLDRLVGDEITCTSEAMGRKNVRLFECIKSWPKLPEECLITASYLPQCMETPAKRKSV